MDFIKSLNDFADWEATHKLFEDIVKTIDIDDFKKRWNDSTIYFIIHDNKKIGYTLITPRNEIGYFIIPEYQRRGIGTLAIEELMKDEPRKYYWAMIPHDNPNSMKFIKSMGFKPSGSVYAINST